MAPPAAVSFDVGPVAFSAAPDVTAALRAGAVDPDVAYMRGQLKVAGDMAAFYDLLPLAASEAFQAALTGP